MNRKLKSNAQWSVDEIPFHDVQAERVRTDPYLLYLVTASSFVEITSDLYTRNLVEYFDDDPSLQRWLEEVWEPEEVQHGHALKRYVETVWPEFDWELAYRRFFNEYSKYCQTELLADSPALELASRCVVETGTSTFYTALARFSPEPVLSELAERIKTDEVRHFRRFYHDFLDRADTEGVGRLKLLHTLWQRLGEVEQEDAYFAFKHVYETAHPGRRFGQRDYRRFRRYYARLLRENYPFRTAVNMFCKPLRLNRTVSRFSTPALAAGARLVLR